MDEQTPRRLLLDAHIWPLVRGATRRAVQLRNREICRRFRLLTETRHRAARGASIA